MTSLPPVVAFTGFAGSGKSTAAQWVLRNHPQVINLSFATPLKKMVYELIRSAAPAKWPITAGEYLNNLELKETPIPFLGDFTPRYLMQTLGTEWGRNAVHPDFWIGIMAGKLERLLGSSFKNSETVPIKAVLDDARFPNEIELLRMFGAMIVRVDRPGTAPATPSTHASENPNILHHDAILVNDGSMEAFHEKLATLLPVQPKKA